MNDDTIYRQAAIDALCKAGCDSGHCGVSCDDVKAIENLPSAQPERLTDDDFETIRIHLNAYKEKLGNQHRWEEAEEYQRIIDKFIAFASAQPELIRCKDCKHWTIHKRLNIPWCRNLHIDRGEDDFCSSPERRQDATD